MMQAASEAAAAPAEVRICLNEIDNAGLCMYQEELQRAMRDMEEKMVRDPHKMTLPERVELLENAATLLGRHTPATPRERKRLKQIREEVCVALVVDGYKQHDDGSWYQP